MLNKTDVVSIRLVRDGSLISDRVVRNPYDVAAVFAESLRDFNKEVVCLINVDGKGRPINCSYISMGSSNAAQVSFRDIFSNAILSGAKNIMLLHNHPSGNIRPSSDDIRLTDGLIKMSNVMNIPLLDHIIIGDTDEYYSFFQKDVCRFDMYNRPKTVDYAEDVDFSARFVADPGTIFQTEGQTDSNINNQSSESDKTVAAETATRHRKGR